MAGMIREGIAKADLEPTKICLHWIDWCGDEVPRGSIPNSQGVSGGPGSILTLAENKQRDIGKIVRQAGSKKRDRQRQKHLPARSKIGDVGAVTMTKVMGTKTQ